MKKFYKIFAILVILVGICANAATSSTDNTKSTKDTKSVDNSQAKSASNGNKKDVYYEYNFEKSNQLALRKVRRTYGCGLGYFLFHNSDMTGATVAMYSTSAGSSQQSGLTSGTSGCDEKTLTTYSSNDIKLVHDYIATNMDQFMIDASYGKGKTLDAVASLVAPDNMAAFELKVQKNYNNIFTNKNVTSEEVTNNLYRSVIM